MGLPQAPTERLWSLHSELGSARPAQARIKFIIKFKITIYIVIYFNDGLIVISILIENNYLAIIEYLLRYTKVLLKGQSRGVAWVGGTAGWKAPT